MSLRERFDAGLRWLEEETDKEYLHRARVGVSTVLSNDAELFTAIVSALKPNGLNHLERIEVCDVFFVRAGLIDTSDRSLLIPQRLLKATAGGPEKVTCMLWFAEHCISMLQHSTGASPANLWDQGVGPRLIETNSDHAAEARRWALENLRLVRSSHPIRRKDKE